MSTSEYEQNEYNAATSEDGQPRNDSIEGTPSNKVYEIQLFEEMRPLSASPSIKSSNRGLSRPGTASTTVSKVATPPNELETEPDLAELTSQFATECDLLTTQAPLELLPQIDSSSSKNDENPVVISSPTAKKSLIKKRVVSAEPTRGLCKTPSGIPKNLSSNSSIPIKISKQASSRLSIKPSKTGSLRSQLRGPRAITNKHTLEIQFLNKHKRLVEFKKELIEKQRPVMDLYQNLLEIKKQLAEFGKAVEIEEVKLVAMEDPKKKCDNPSGDTVNQEIVQNMKSSIENIPKALMTVCQNLVGRRDALVDLLESVSQADIEPFELTDRIESLKSEGKELKESLDSLITQSEKRITELVKNWYQLLESNNQGNKDTNKLAEYESSLRQKEAIIKESKMVISDLQRKLEDKRNLHEKTISEFEITIKEYTDTIKKLNNELESERRSASEFKTRNVGNGQTIKSLRQKLNEAENKLKDFESKNNDLTKKLKSAQDQVRQKETVWAKEKEELNKNLKNQDKLLGKLTEDRNSIQTRLEVAKKTKNTEESTLKIEVENLRQQFEATCNELEQCKREKIEAEQKYQKLESELEKTGDLNKRNIEEISKQIDWGKSVPSSDAQAELYSELLAARVTIREYEEQIKIYEKETAKWNVEKAELMEKADAGNFNITQDINRQEELINKYKKLLEESEVKLNEKSVEVAKISAEMKHLKIRQDALEEQNADCPTEELKNMVAEGRRKLSELMKKSMENEQKIACYESTIEKQHKQMNEMENLLRVRDGLIGMIKAKKDELLMEKDSLTRYCKDVRNMLAETREDLRVKSEVIRDLQEKLEKKEKMTVALEKKVRELEENLAYTNEKRFKLQDTIGSMEKELQSTKAHVNQMVELQQSRYDLVPDLNSSNPSDGPVKIKIMLG